MDRTAFQEFYLQTADALRRYAVNVLNDAALADDIVQEAYVRALASPNLPAAPDEARAYLYRIASNLAVDHWRRRRRAAHSGDAEAVEFRDSDAALRIDVAAAFSRLSVRERQMVWLAHVEGADHAAIAAALGVGEASVRVMLHRARAKMASLLRRNGYGE